MQDALQRAYSGALKRTPKSTGVSEPVYSDVAVQRIFCVSGGTISPPIFESLEFLGKEKTLARIDRCLANG